MSDVRFERDDRKGWYRVVDGVRSRKSYGTWKEAAFAGENEKRPWWTKPVAFLRAVGLFVIDRIR